MFVHAAACPCSCNSVTAPEFLIEKSLTPSNWTPSSSHWTWLETRLGPTFLESCLLINTTGCLLCSQCNDKARVSRSNWSLYMVAPALDSCQAAGSIAAAHTLFASVAPAMICCQSETLGAGNLSISALNDFFCRINLQSGFLRCCHDVRWNPGKSIHCALSPYNLLRVQDQNASWCTHIRFWNGFDTNLSEFSLAGFHRLPLALSQCVPPLVFGGVFVFCSLQQETRPEWSKSEEVLAGGPKGITLTEKPSPLHFEKLPGLGLSTPWII